MQSLLVTCFWWFDLAIGVGTLVAVLALRHTGRISVFTWKLFWAGCLLGLLWEIPLSTLDGLGVVRVFEFLSPPPVHFALIIVSHTLWDGGLLLLGVAMVTVSCPSPRFRSFRRRELAVLLGWGQVQALGIELLATGTAGWIYVPAPWNPALFGLCGHSITLLPQLIWLVAPVVFYFWAIVIRRAQEDRTESPTAAELEPELDP